MSIKQFGENLASARKTKGISQAHLASMLDVTTQTVSRWENGDCAMPVDKLTALGVQGFDVVALLSPLIQPTPSPKQTPEPKPDEIKEMVVDEIVSLVNQHMPQFVNRAQLDVVNTAMMRLAGAKSYMAYQGLLRKAENGELEFATLIDMVN